MDCLSYRDLPKSTPNMWVHFPGPLWIEARENDSQEQIIVFLCLFGALLLSFGADFLSLVQLASFVTSLGACCIVTGFRGHDRIDVLDNWCLVLCQSRSFIILVHFSINKHTLYSFQPPPNFWVQLFHLFQHLGADFLHLVHVSNMAKHLLDKFG